MKEWIEIIAGGILVGIVAAIMFMFVALMGCLGLFIRIGPVLIVIALFWAIAEHQGWMNLVEWM